jgi:hypothetical protein
MSEAQEAGTECEPSVREAEFDAFRRTRTAEGHGENISGPYLCVAREAAQIKPAALDRADAYNDRVAEALRDLPEWASRDWHDRIGQSRAIAAHDGGRLDDGSLGRQAGAGTSIRPER